MKKEKWKKYAEKNKMCERLYIFKNIQINKLTKVLIIHYSAGWEEKRLK